jgi:hypothetical protein
MNLKLSDFDKKHKAYADGGFSEGGRHNAAVSYANHLLFQAKMPETTFRYEMVRWNNTNKPPLPEKELQRIIDDAWQHFQIKGDQSG